MTPKNGRGGVLPPSTVLQDRYRILRLYDQGGSATVYLAERLGVDEAVPLAVKELNPDVFSLAEFKNEVNVLYSLNHPNLPKVYDFFEEDGKHYLVLDFVQGKTLKQILFERGPLGEEEALDYALQVCDIMSYLHDRAERKIIHRDVKPTNLMLTQAGQIKLLDFGIARVPDSQLPGNRLHAYTEDYAAPEQKANLATDHRSDIYSFGVTLKFLLDGEVPGTAELAGPPGQKPAGLSREMRRVISRCLRPNPEDRYQSFQELARDLQAYRQAKRTRLLRTLWTAAAVVGLAAVILLARVFIVPPVYPIVGAGRVEVGTATALQVGLPTAWSGSLDSIVWDIIDTQAPGRTHDVQRGRYCTFTSTDLGVFQVQAYVEQDGRRRRLSEVKSIEVYPALDVPGEILVGQDITLRSPGATAGQGRRYTWEWVVRGPIEGGSADGVPVRKTTTEPRYQVNLGAVGKYEIQVNVNVSAPGGLQASLSGVPKIVFGVTEVAVDPSRVVNRNVSFEEQYGGSPVDWVLVYTDRVIHDKTVGRTGSRSLRFTAAPGQPSPYAVELVPLEAGRSYRVTAWVRGENVAEGSRIAVEARFRSTSDETYVLREEAAVPGWTGTFDWRQVMLTFTIPPGNSVNLELYLRVSGSGRVWFDDCAVERIG
jgi:hypothetical protein